MSDISRCRECGSRDVRYLDGGLALCHDCKMFYDKIAREHYEAEKEEYERSLGKQEANQ